MTTDLTKTLKAIACTYGHPEETEDFVPAVRGGYLMITRDWKDPATGRRYADCVCRCGRKLLNQHYTTIVHGVVRSCGCKTRRRAMQREKEMQKHVREHTLDHPLRKDMRGLELGYLTVVDYKIDDEGAFRWVVECACGTRILYTAQTLKTTKRRTCKSPVCTQLFADGYPKKKVLKHINMNFAGKIPGDRQHVRKKRAPNRSEEEKYAENMKRYKPSRL